MNWHNFVHKCLPKREDIHNSRYLCWLNKHLHYEEIWAFNRHTIAKGFVAGFLIAFIPLPIQFIMACLFAVLLRGNLPIAVFTTLLTNPFTFAPIYYAIFRLGEWVSGETVPYHELPKFDWHAHGLTELMRHLATWFSAMGKPLLLGIPVATIVCCVASYCLVYAIAKIVDWMK